jgi:hypothetical protein
VEGGDRQITLEWVPNPEPDLFGYRLYRTADAAATDDLRRMTRLATPAPTPALWNDAPVPAGTLLYYRLVAVDTAGNASAPSAVAAGSAFDDSHPAPPTWGPAVPGAAPGSLVLSWASPVPNLKCLVERQVSGTGEWQGLGWLPRGQYTFADERRQPSVAYSYRLRVLDAAGRANVDFQVLTS